LKLKDAAAVAIVVLIPSIYVFMSPLIRGLELTNLFFYMDVWPAALAVFGYAIAYLASKRFNFHRFIPLYLGLGASALTITYWHLPANSLFGYGVCPADLNNPLLYQAKRLSYVAVGFYCTVSRLRFLSHGVKRWRLLWARSWDGMGFTSR
jgi:hypothetical protein